MTKRRILMIGNYLNSPRHNKNVWQALAERLPSMGWEGFTTSSKESQLSRLYDMLMTIVKQRKNYDLAQIDVFSGKAFIYAECCAWLLRCLHKKIVLTLHGGGLPDFANLHPYRIRSLLSGASAVVTPSPFLQQQLNKYFDRVQVIPNGIDVSGIPIKPRQSWHPNLIWVRAFHQTYNPELAVKVLALLSQDYPGARLMMVGPDKGDGSLQAVRVLASQLGVETQLTLLSAVSNDQVPSLLDQADIFVNTTNFDTSPRSLLEAMANGMCVVSTNVGGIPWMITDSRDGLLVPSNDAEAMVSAIKLLLEDPTMARAISTNARQTAEAHDWNNVLPEWQKLFTQVLEGRNESV